MNPVTQIYEGNFHIDSHGSGTYKFYCADGRFVKLTTDADCPSPREDDCLGTFYTWLTSHNSPDCEPRHSEAIAYDGLPLRAHSWYKPPASGNAPDLYELAESLGFPIPEDLATNPLLWVSSHINEAGGIALPVSKYEHGPGTVTYRTGDPGQFIDSDWDAGWAGIIFATGETLYQEYLLDPSMSIPKETYEIARRVLEAEVDEYTEWAQGHCYEATIHEQWPDVDDGPVIEHLGSFIGDDLEQNGLLDEIGEALYRENSIAGTLSDKLAAQRSDVSPELLTPEDLAELAASLSRPFDPQALNTSTHLAK